MAKQLFPSVFFFVSMTVVLHKCADCYCDIQFFIFYIITDLAPRLYIYLFPTSCVLNCLLPSELC